jgi:glycosyltransferase involved in cell wall biosynthesis
VALILALSLAGQMAVFWRFANVFHRSRPSPGPKRARSKVAVVLPVRNGDHQLSKAISSVLTQNYPNVQLIVVVDDITDPAYEIARRAIPPSDSDRVRVTLLRERHPECGLVCSSLLQALGELDDDADVITFAAADTVLPSTWVTELLAALDQPRTGATLGNRWYRLSSNSPGNVIQFLWNAGAVIPMWLFSIPWAGAIALRRSDIDAAGLPHIWRTTIVEDAPVAKAMLQSGKHLSFSPQLFVGIDESIDLHSCIRFICRQMLWTRLYHSQWNRIGFSVIAGALAVWIPVLIFLYAITQNAWTAAGILAVSSIGYVAGLLCMVTRLNALVGRVLRARGESQTELGMARLVVLFVSIPLAQLVSLYSVVTASLATHVWWSGICYHLQNDGGVVMEDPFRERCEGCAT